MAERHYGQDRPPCVRPRTADTASTAGAVRAVPACAAGVLPGPCAAGERQAGRSPADPFRARREETEGIRLPHRPAHPRTTP
jgi:hypothetical protein